MHVTAVATGMAIPCAACIIDLSSGGRRYGRVCHSDPYTDFCAQDHVFAFCVGTWWGIMTVWGTIPPPHSSHPARDPPAHPPPPPPTHHPPPDLYPTPITAPHLHIPTHPPTRHKPRHTYHSLVLPWWHGRHLADSRLWFLHSPHWPLSRCMHANTAVKSAHTMISLLLILPAVMVADYTAHNDCVFANTLSAVAWINLCNH